MPKGHCASCGRETKLYANGTVYRHRDYRITGFRQGAVCEGSQKRPREES